MVVAGSLVKSPKRKTRSVNAEQAESELICNVESKNTENKATKIYSGSAKFLRPLCPFIL